MLINILCNYQWCPVPLSWSTDAVVIQYLFHKGTCKAPCEEPFKVLPTIEEGGACFTDQISTKLRGGKPQNYEPCVKSLSQIITL